MTVIVRCLWRYTNVRYERKVDDFTRHIEPQFLAFMRLPVDAHRYGSFNTVEDWRSLISFVVCSTSCCGCVPTSDCIVGLRKLTDFLAYCFFVFSSISFFADFQLPMVIISSFFGCLPDELYVLLLLLSFNFFLSLFLVVLLENNYIRIYQTDLHQVSADDRSDLHFPIYVGTLLWPIPALYLAHFENELKYHNAILED